MGRLLVIGIDGFDADCLARNIAELPSLRRLAERGTFSKVRSVFPPDSDSAWGTVYTGLTPSEHGILHMENPLVKSARLSTQLLPNDILRGKTLWDYASTLGLRCAVIFPHLGFPAWSVNGLMIGRSTLRDGFSVSGELPRTNMLLPEHNTLKSFPRRGREGMFLDNALSRIDAEAELFSELFRSDEWDLFFCYSSTLDLVEHFLWGLPPNGVMTSCGEYITQAYRACDAMVARVSAELRQGDDLLVVSDHGHGARPKNAFKIQSYIRDSMRGHDSSPDDRLPFRTPRLGRMIAISAVSLLSHVDLRDLLHRLITRMPGLAPAFARMAQQHDVKGISLALGSPIKSYSSGNDSRHVDWTAR